MADTRVRSKSKHVILKKIQLGRAILALKKLEKKRQETIHEKSKLFEADDNSKNVYLQICLKKIPEMDVKILKVNLPHSFPEDKEYEVCLITGDLDKKDRRADPEETVRYYKDILQKQDITNISEVISLRELFTDYKQYEAKRKLCNAYDIFLTDKRIFPSVISGLGKEIYKKNKVPRQIDLNSDNLKEQINYALSYSPCCIRGKGSSHSICIGNITQPKKELIENIRVTAEEYANKIPGNWNNIYKMHIKCSRSLAIPIYVSFELPNEIKLPPPMIQNTPIEDELSTLTNGYVKVYPDGSVDVVTKKKRKKRQIGKTKTCLKMESEATLDDD